MLIVRLSLLTFVAAFLAPLAAHAAWWVSHDHFRSWSEADWSSTGLLPPPRAKPEAAVYVYAARTGRWKGVFAHHSWIVIKERGAAGYTRFDKVAWGRPVKVNNWAPDARWYGHTPMLVAAVEGPAAEQLIPKIKAAVARYPHNQPGAYSVWPGPNSNSFVAYVLAAVPEARAVLPPTAIGKDWRARFPHYRANPQRHRCPALPRWPAGHHRRLGRRRRNQRPGPRYGPRHPPSRPQAARLRPHRHGERVSPTRHPGSRGSWPRLSGTCRKRETLQQNPGSARLRRRNRLAGMTGGMSVHRFAGIRPGPPLLLTRKTS